ncbi:CGNR zinc finger domain-containing protein [Streptomyces marincola]|uniref:CGNR zinc finger domain-containing protein n=1 Tax=Streptomyces marincola TaxID=2878388 RepID=UPI001CF3F780|nr:CGNR zinc finger domain-containing protein [Streptomyces marincola]UCM89678.1 ABATE domain-containing protein [Streptomyces marincola]
MVPGPSPAPSAGIVLRPPTGAAFRFDPGALCLELLVTGGPGEFRRWESLHGPADLVAWAAGSRLSPAPVPEVTDAEAGAARRVRDALWRLMLARLAGEAPPREAVAEVNASAAAPPLVPAIGPDGARVWAPPVTGAALLSTVARDAVALLTGPHLDRLRVCEGERCHLVFVDTSRAGRRRWCSMERCGNLHKVRALRARREREA